MAQRLAPYYLAHASTHGAFPRHKAPLLTRVYAVCRVSCMYLVCILYVSLSCIARVRAARHVRAAYLRARRRLRPNPPLPLNCWNGSDA
jgi:hypothetical protein